MDPCVQCCRSVPLYTYWGSPRYYFNRDNMCKECFDEVQREIAQRRQVAPDVVPEQEQAPLAEQAGEKACTTCDRMLPLSNYCYHASCKDRLASTCRECKSRYNRDYIKRRAVALDAPEEQEQEQEQAA